MERYIERNAVVLLAYRKTAKMLTAFDANPHRMDWGAVAADVDRELKARQNVWDSKRIANDKEEGDIPVSGAVEDQGRAMLEKTGKGAKLPILRRILSNFKGIDIDAAVGIAIGCESLHEAPP